VEEEESGGSGRARTADRADRRRVRGKEAIRLGSRDASSLGSRPTNAGGRRPSWVRPGAEDYDQLAARAEAARFEFGAVLIACYEDLIDLENLAGRDEDLIDIRALREAGGDLAPE
jgi:hypothetical protein